uniref:G-protein coupled receptors family 1 profile domain-containing protein n=1 Tax=Romanomermis culicivorax TaxID=13658 RepID=A0A915I9B7_ROMCU
MPSIVSLHRPTSTIFPNLHIIDGIMKNSNEELRNYWCLILTILPIICVFGNLTVIYIVIREKCLHTSTNLILVSLACADILVAILVMPFSIYLITNNLVWDLPDYMCDFFCAADVSASTSSIVHLVAVSIDRFYAVVKHTEYNTSKHQHRTYWIIGLCWVFSLSIALPLGIGLNEKNAPPPPFNVEIDDGPGQTPQKYCSIDNPYFMLSSSIFAFYIPCFVMLIMYGIVFNKLRRSLLAVRLREMAASHMISFGNSMGKWIGEVSRETWACRGLDWSRAKEKFRCLIGFLTFDP